MMYSRALGRFRSWDGAARRQEEEDRNPYRLHGAEEAHTHIHIGEHFVPSRGKPGATGTAHWSGQSGHDDDAAGDIGERVAKLEEAVGEVGQAVSKIITLLENASKGGGEEQDSDEEEEEREASADGDGDFAGEEGGQRLDRAHEHRTTDGFVHKPLGSNYHADFGLPMNREGIAHHESADALRSLQVVHDVAHGITSADRQAEIERRLAQTADTGLPHEERLRQLNLLSERFYRPGRRH